MTPPIRLSSDQRAQFARDGFLLLPGLLSGDETRFYLEVVERICSEFRCDNNLEPHQTVEIRNAIERAPELLELISHPVALGAMLDILGANIQLTTSHVFARTPNPGEKRAFKAIDWHADGPNPRPPRVETVDGPAEPRLYAKIGYFLTDLSEPNKGNLRVVPGSHRLAAKPPVNPETGEPRDMIELLTKPGDGVLFENRCWHAVGPNYSTQPRQNIYIGYCHRWMKAMDFERPSDELLAKADPIQKQLLGVATNPLSYYLPDRYKGDLPLGEYVRG